jgi:hypothetical protein
MPCFPFQKIVVESDQSLIKGGPASGFSSQRVATKKPSLLAVVFGDREAGPAVRDYSPLRSGSAERLALLADSESAPASPIGPGEPTGPNPNASRQKNRHCWRLFLATRTGLRDRSAHPSADRLALLAFFEPLRGHWQANPTGPNPNASRQKNRHCWRLFLATRTGFEPVLPP